MARKRSRTRSSKASPKASPPLVRTLTNRVKRLETALARACARHAQQLERVRRAADRRLAVMMREIAILRHHEARAEALARLLAAHGVATTTRGIGDGEDPGLPG